MTPSDTTTAPEWLVHGRVRLALHRLSDGPGRPLLVLHGLGEQSAAVPRSWVQGWPGSVHGIDFTGHGRSTVPAGGGYTAEVLMADADHALAHLGEATVLGRGLGAYVALLLAGARPETVAGAILADGPGLAGGGPSPHSPSLGPVPAKLGSVPDPFALAELALDVRPADYASSFARHAVERSRFDTPLCVAAVVRPPWLQVVAAEPGVSERPVLEALHHYALVP